MLGGPPQYGLDVLRAARTHHGHGFSRRRIECTVLAVLVGDGRVGDHHAVGKLGDQAGEHIGVHQPILRSCATAWAVAPGPSPAVAARPVPGPPPGRGVLAVADWPTVRPGAWRSDPSGAAQASTALAAT